MHYKFKQINIDNRHTHIAPYIEAYCLINAICTGLFGVGCVPPILAQ